MIANPPAAGKPTILCLPRELRDIIIENSFLDRDPVSIELPNYPWSPPEKRLCGTKYATHEQLLQHYPLLMVNHQFRIEGLEVLSKLAASRYQVDILLYQRQRLVLFMPMQKIPTRFKHVHAKLYVLKDDEMRDRYLWHNLYRIGDGGPSPYCWKLYRIVQRFLQWGPLNATQAPADAHILVETLELDVRSKTGIPEGLLSPPNIDYKFEWFDFWELGERLCDLRNQTWMNYKMHPDYLVALLHYLLQRILVHHDGRVIYERVGLVRLLLDGRRMYEWNLDECLKEMSSENQEHVQWRNAVLAHRSQMGFR